MNAITIVADRVTDVSDIPSAIIGEDYIPGLGRITLFTDIVARESWAKYVRPLKDKGTMVALNSKGEQVSIVWGRR